MLRRILFLLSLFLSLNTFAQSFNTIWNTANTSGGSSADNEVRIPTNPAFTTYNYTVDWGDGMQDTNVTGDITHTYAAQGTYTISISGTFPAIYFNNSGDRQKIIEILAWGAIEWQTMEDAFHGCTYLNFDAIDSPDLSQVTSLRNMFRSATSFNGIVNNWDISNVTDISGLFAGANIFNRPLDLWNTSSVTTMEETFLSANNFNEPLDNWNTASVTNMRSMFSSASRFNQNINNWNVSGVTDMSGTFRYTGSYNQPLNNWNVNNVTDMSSMFDSSGFNFPIENWNVDQVTNMSGMFRHGVFNHPLDGWNVSAVTDMSEMFQRHRTFNQPLNSWNVSNVTDMSGMFDGWIWGAIFNQPLDNWDVSNVTDMSYMFRDNTGFNQDISGWDVSGVDSMQGMFEDAAVFNQNISGWNVSNVSNMRSMFQETDVFDQPLNTWNISNVTEISSMFFRASAFNQPLDTWNLSGITNLQNMFSEATSFNQDLSAWSTASITNMSGMFNQATAFDQNLSGWDITNVTNMANMLSDSGVSQENYDNILIGWAAQTVSDNVDLGATNLTYCDGLSARQELIDDHNWNITGDTVNCSFVLCTEITMPAAGDTMTPANSDIRWNPAPNATGYRVTLEIERGGARNYALIGGAPANNLDVGNVVGLDFTNEFQPGDIVYVTVVPYNDEGPATGCDEISFTVVESWVNSPNALKLTYDTNLQYSSFTTPINQLKIETSPGLTYDYSIDWGDGQYDNNVTADITHTYLTPGIYTVSIIGTFPAPRHEEFNSDAYKLLSIDQWGTQVWESMSGAFAGCQNMEYNATDIPNLSNVTDMSRMFIVCYNFNGNINNWDVSNVTNMFATFGVASSFDQPLNNWDVSNVTGMGLMFFRTDVFNQDISNWNTSNVIDMQRMFEDADAFDQPLNSWDVSNVTDMHQMFQRAQVFNQPLNNWDVGNVNDMEEMFDSAGAFNQNIDAWDVSSVVGMGEMFNSAQVFNQPLNSWDVSSVDDMRSMFSNAIAFNQPLNNWNVSSVINMSSMFSSASSFNQNLNSWNVTDVTNMSRMFNFATSFDQPLNNWDVNSVVNMSSMFQGAAVFNQPLDNWNVSAVANMTSMFESAIAFNQPINTWDVSSVTLMESMFEEAESFNQELNNWDVSVVTNFESMFKDAIAFDQPLSNWDTGEALTMEQMFYGASVFNQNIDTWDVSFVTTMASMFRDAIAYNQDMNAWNVASVTTMQSMFQNATAFNGIVESWNVRRVLTMESMFEDATAFNQTLNNWRMSGVANMSEMLRNASMYNQPMDQWDLGNVSMRSTFENATALDQYLGDWNVSNVNDMRDMLDNTALTRENYDATLIAWSEQTLTPGINLGAQGLLYCDALEERQSMIDTYGWSFTGDILDCPIPECTQLVSPLNGATDVPVNTNLTWEPVLYANGYRLTVGTTPGGSDLVNGDVINDTFYEFAADFAGGETVYVTLIPFNDTGDAVGPCTEESFTISSAPASVPDCTTLSDPLNTAIDVVIDTDLSWNAIANADAYILTVGTTSGGTDIVDNVDVGNVTTYEIPFDLPEDSDIFVTIIPYNTEGNANPCSEESFRTEIIPTAPICTNLTDPTNGATNVPIETDLTWNAVANATGYLISVGTTSNGIEVVNSVDVGNVTTFDIPEDLQEDRLYYVTIIPYNDVGDAVNCTEETFRTGSTNLNDPPECTTLSNPLNGATDIAIDTDLTWNATANTNGYHLTVGTTTGGNDILDNEDVGNVTTYDLPVDLPEGTIIFVTIVPYNGFGDATPCTEESFTTETLPTVPTCTSLTIPLDGATDVSISTNLSWNAVSNADGYRLSVRDGASVTYNILDNVDVGNITTYDLPNDLPENSDIYVLIIPYNGVGDADGCTEEIFVTGEPTGTLPECTNLSSPLHLSVDVPVNTNITWDAAPQAEGYRLTIGTAPGLGDILDDEDVANITTYNPPNDLPEGIEVFVFVQPYNSTGDAEFCEEESFITAEQSSIGCTALTNPINGAIDVPIDVVLSWNAVAGADGYYVSLGTSSGDNDLLNNLLVSDATTTEIPFDLPEQTQIFVTILPFDAVGTASGCNEESFTTGDRPTLPACTSLTLPENGASNVAIDIGLEWESITNADGYYLTVGTTPNGNEIIDAEDVGLLTTYNFVEPLPFGQSIFVSVTPYNDLGNAEGCDQDSFTTIEREFIESLFGFSPDGDGNNDFWTINGIEEYPNNTVMIYNRWGDMVFKIEGYDNASNVFTGQANQLTGMGADQLPEGTYFFIINIAEDHSLQKTQGYLVLKR